MPAKRMLTICLMAILLSGCGQLVSERLAVSNKSAAGQCPTSQRVVIMPFADYTYESSLDKAFHRNLLIMENLIGGIPCPHWRNSYQQSYLRIQTM